MLSNVLKLSSRRCGLNATSRLFSTSAKKKILIPTSLNIAAKNILEDNNFEVILDSNKAIGDLVHEHSDAYGLIVRSEKVNEEIINKMPNLKVIVRAGAGYNTIDIKKARKAGIDVMNTPGANANAVAEEVVAMALSALRGVIPADVSTRAGKWEKKKFLGQELADKTVGIIGLGNIGQLVQKRLSGFNCKFIGYDPLISSKKANDLEVKLMSVEEIFESADVITLHIPENEETKKSINMNLFRRMKEGSCLINCARQGIINEDDLREIKKSKKILYCTDVYVKDEAGDKPIKDVADVMLPHIGANTIEANTNAAKRAASQIVDWEGKGVKTFVVNKGVPEGLNKDYQLLAFYLANVASKFSLNTQPHSIETSFYGELFKFNEWLTPSVTLGISKDFDPTYDFMDSKEFLKSKGISYETRITDEKKNYGESITVDLFSGNNETYQKVSVRGTITEGRPMVSRINNYNNLYFDPTGHNVLVEYEDRPGVLASITNIIGDSGINILDTRAPQDLVNGRALTVCKMDKPLEEGVISRIEESVNASKCVNVSI